MIILIMRYTIYIYQWKLDGINFPVNELYIYTNEAIVTYHDNCFVVRLPFHR